MRKRLRFIRLEMTVAEHTIASKAIVGRLKSEFDWSKVRSLHYFEPIPELMEVDISDLITWLEGNYQDIQLVTPRLIAGEWEMISIKDQVAPRIFDVIIVPMLGFDSSLHRIGYGGGYYDKFLAGQVGAKTIGVCFESGRVEKIPTEPHDIALNMIVTEVKNHQL